MTKSQSDATHEPSPSDDTGGADAMSKLRAAVTRINFLITGPGRPDRNRQASPPAGGNASAAEPAAATRRQLGKKPAWTLGVIVMIAIVSVVLSALASMSLPGARTTANVAAALPSASSRPSVPDARAGLSPATGTAGTRQLPHERTRPSGTSARPGKVATLSPVLHGTPARAATAGSAAPALRSEVGLPPATGSNASLAAGAAGQPLTMSIPKPVSFWSLNDDDTGMIANDLEGAHPATGSNASWCTDGTGNCAGFNGTSSQFTTSGPVLNTGPGSSFTVSASVYMTAYTADNGSQTAVSQDATDGSGFYLQYTAAFNRWAFVRDVADVDQSPAGYWALSASAPALNTWAQLVGVFNASDGRLSLYVNGVLQGTATDPAPFASSGPLAIGRAKYNGQLTDWFDGAINQVKVWNVALTAAEVATVYG